MKSIEKSMVVALSLVRPGSASFVKQVSQEYDNMWLDVELGKAVGFT